MAKVVKMVRYDVFEIFYLQLYAALIQNKYIFIISIKSCATLHFVRFLSAFVKKLEALENGRKRVFCKNAKIVQKFQSAVSLKLFELDLKNLVLFILAYR